MEGCADRLSDSSASALIQLQIQVKGNAPEVVKKATAKGIEVVSKNGLVFFRKRKSHAIQEDQENRPAKQQEAEVSHADENHASAAPPAPALVRELAEPEQHLQQTPQKQSGKAVDMPPGHIEQAQDPLVVLHEQLQECLPESCPAAIKLQLAVERLLIDGAAALEREGTQTSACEQGKPSTPLLDAARSIASTFNRLLHLEVDQSQTLLLQPGSTDAMQQYNQLPPVIKELSQETMLKVYMQQQLAQLQHEEACWLELQQKYSQPCNNRSKSEAADEAEAAHPECSSKGNTPTAAVATTAAAETAGGKAGTGQGTRQAHDVLKAKQEEVHTQLTVQIEAMSSMMSKVETILAQAEQACVMLQSGYHQEKFKTFQHVNSPAWLIQEILRRQQRMEHMADE
mmetsp:Transcript_21364/g.46718  ORF Transcript_21364/g.46718 Transcript_21364/m.46718 type:complete len:400 (+) Transcript_21364:115-1314(+)|eukprot:CAMPEP_0202896232 /NCGR_PEP_ID=MMETSP1392-20130828/5262_1 /ASSEMBLY_ACC=CAM_ASM_000868 /TAXON_ID=225041 /ORGANISM="Chlamydomonas chlamydogama, Strain SAG 11-48b" /LENGTH=399 /DNA_ID=CAMNT_0049581501 /DNA_START=22 /DNA_END=1221 /DNA_ORIENTATION=+